MCPLGGRQKSWGTRHVHKVLSQTYQNLGQVRGRTQRWCLPASLVSEESLKSLVYLIRSLFSGHSYKYKQTYHFHRMSSNVFQSAASVLCCGVVCSQVRTVSPFLTVPQNSWTQECWPPELGDQWSSPEWQPQKLGQPDIKTRTPDMCISSPPGDMCDLVCVWGRMQR